MIKTLKGTSEEMIELSALIRKYFSDRQKEYYIPKDCSIEVKWKLWPIKQFEIAIKNKTYGEKASIPFMPVIEDFGSAAETIIESMVESITKDREILKN